MKTVRIAYANMWGAAETFPAHYLIECFPYLGPHYQFELSANPELVFHSVYGYVPHHRPPGAKHFVYAGEPGDHFARGAKISPGVYEKGFYQFGITCALNETSPNHRYMPQGLLHIHMYNGGLRALIRQPGEPLPRKEHFCNFVYSNGNSKRRIEFYNKLSQYKRIESCGCVERNNDALVSAAYSREGYLLKQAFQARCKFSIAMENTVFPGYNTEKLTDPLVARSVPIYWGDPEVARFWNRKAFINVSDFASDEAAIEHIKHVDNNDELYQSYLHEPPFRGNVVPDELSDDYYLEFWRQVL